MPTDPDIAKSILPVIMVYAYKFDDKGYLKQCKAHLCVLGDHQVMTHAETHAATLATCCF